MPVWWPNDVFEWTALKNLSHRYDGQLGDSYSNCLRLAIVQGYEYYKKDPYTFVEENGEDLPPVAAIKRVKLTLNPQVKHTFAWSIRYSYVTGVRHDSAV